MGRATGTATHTFLYHVPNNLLTSKLRGGCLAIKAYLMNNFGEKKFVLVLGNGFDLSLELKTRYSDFSGSNEWKVLHKKYVSKTRRPSLLKYLKYRSDVEEWFNIEQALLDYVRRNNSDASNRDISKDKQEYETVCWALGKYLTNHVEKSSHGLFDFPATRLLSLMARKQNTKIYTFNYTPLDLLLRVMNITDTIETVYIHGKAADYSLVLGIETDFEDDIIPGYEFLLKSYNPHYKSIEIFEDMKMADEVIIFGHSLNMIDSVYFDDFFQELISNKASHHRITIICKDEMSKNSILDNIKNMGISIPKLFQYGKLELILTKNISENSKDGSAFEELLNRISN